MKSIVILFISLFLVNNSFGQVISYEDFKAVIPFLQKEDFKAAFEKTSKLLDSTENVSSDLRGIVTYMNIYSSAGMVAKDQMTFDDFSKNAKKFIGQYVVMSAHPSIDSTAHKSNSFQLIKTTNGKLEGMTITTNKDNTNILCFEYFEFADEINPSNFIGKNVRCGGILKSVEVNPIKSKIWICRVRLKDAFARVMTPR